MSDRDDCQRLLDATLPFAEQMLHEYGEFLPFGAEMRLDGEVVSISGYNGNEHPPAKEIIALLNEHFRIAASRSQVMATALAYDVRVTPPGSKDATDAVAIGLDHQSGYTVDVYFPYRIEQGIVTLHEPFANEGQGGIFQTITSCEK